MDVLPIYILKSTICLSLFYWGYKFLLSKETFFKFNRLALLIGITISLCLPFVEIELSEESRINSNIITSLAPEIEENNEAIAITTMLDKYETSLIINDTPQLGENSKSEITPLIISENKTTKANIPWTTILLAVYFLGIFINLTILIISYIRMRKIISKGEEKCIYDLQYLSIDESISPFSWRNKIVVSKNDENNIEEIVIHEHAHIMYKHYLDILFSEFILLFHWFNPFAWKLKQELKDIHEYQADNKVINSGINTIKYQLLILEKAVGSSSYALANSFNHSKIKKRITMMLKQKSKSWNRLKLLFLIPVAILSIYAFACTGLNPKSESTEKTEENEITESEDESTGRAIHLPVEEKFLKRMASGYGYRTDPIYGTLKLHTGMDYSADEGTPVHAIKEGTIIQSDSIHGYGHIIKIAHKHGIESWYAHNKENLVKVGDKIKLGQRIALVGKSGITTGPHLHLEVRIYGIPINPGKIYEHPSENGEALINTNLYDFLTSDSILAHPIPTYTEGRKEWEEYGMRKDPIYGTLRMNTGLGFGANLRDTVYAFRNGIVTEASEAKWGYGKLIKLQHADNMQTYYAHCDQLLVNEGEWVKAGEPIALSGNTGKSTRPHLHLEVRIDTVPQDPNKFYNFSDRKRFENISSIKN